MTDPYLLGIMCEGSCRNDGCPKCGYKLSIGDPIEVRAVERSPFVRGVKYRWLPATIIYVNEAEIGVAFADGDRLALPRKSGGPKQWRTPA